MTILRLIFFIPAFLLTLIAGNYLIDIVFYLLNFVISIETSPLSFIWDDFLKSTIVSCTGVYIGLLVFPLKNKFLPLIIFSLFYLLSLVFLFSSFESYGHFSSEKTTIITSVRQISITVGIVIGVGIIWYQYLNGEMKFD
jgi:hypothetical protein